MKRIIICCDGTWNNPEQKAVSNVVKVSRALVPEVRGVPQVVFYDWGVGSEGGAEKFSGGISGVGINKNIKDAYRFLVHNYETGDEICFLGFSRGAYTARSTVGMIRNVGVLQKRFADLIPRAYAIYRQKAGLDVGGGYKESGLADIALLWMVEQAEAAGLGFDRDYLADIADPDVLGKLHRSRRGLYWAKRAYLRPVGEFGVLEKVHETVRQRMGKSNYHPPNIDI